jgi:tetratricopeptide (TPR) repeat protein
MTALLPLLGILSWLLGFGGVDGRSDIFIGNPTRVSALQSPFAPLILVSSPARSIFDGDLGLIQIPISTLVGIFIATVAHEAGHAICAWLAGVPIRLVSIGRGPVIATVRLSHTQVILRRAPIAGWVQVYPPLIFERRKFLFFSLGGALGNLGVVVLIVLLGSNGLVPERVQIGAAFVAVTQIVIMGNLIPYREGERASDGLNILQLLRLPAKALTAEGERYAARRARYAGGSPMPAPRPAQADSLRMAYYLDRVDFRSAQADRSEFLDAAQRALARGALARDEEILVLDALVTIGAVSRDPDYLCFLDEWSRRALAFDPSLPTLRGSRGAALVALGRYDEGEAVLASVDATASPEDFALSQLFLAKVHMARGDAEAARRSIEAARRVDAAAIAREPWATLVSDLGLTSDGPVTHDAEATPA